MMFLMRIFVNGGIQQMGLMISEAHNTGFIVSACGFIILYTYTIKQYEQLYE